MARWPRELSPTPMAWRLDWKKPEEYAYLKDASPKQWAWEFLRRNPLYKNLREELLRPYLGQRSLLKEAKTLLVKRPFHWFKKGNTPILKICRDIGSFNDFFGLACFPPAPRRKLPDLEFQAVQIFAGLGDADYRVDLVLSDNEVVCLFDLERPIKTQTKYLAERLEKIRKERKMSSRGRKRGINYIDYLRISDAQACAASSREIAKILFPKVFYSNPASAMKRVQDYSDAVKKLIEKDYRLLGIKRS